jgi:hypothetical protein
MRNVEQNLKILSRTDLIKLKGGKKGGKTKVEEDTPMIDPCPPPEPPDNM